ncbi:MAG TPA: DUF2934 domain-containing protein [Anaeromyxobacter sp.]
MAIRQRTKASAKTSPDTSKAPVASAPRPPPADAVASRAYELWRQSGCTHGNDQAHWFQAEQELRARPPLR